MDAPASRASVDIADELAGLMVHLHTVPDQRHRRGRVHPLPGVLGLVVLGLMAGCRSLSAIHRYAEIHPEVFAPLGLRRPGRMFMRSSRSTISMPTHTS